MPDPSIHAKLNSKMKLQSSNSELPEQNSTFSSSLLFNSLSKSIMYKLKTEFDVTGGVG